MIRAVRRCALAAAFAGAPLLARAGERGPDATHGRIEGDVAVVVGAGASFGPRAPRALADARLRYLSTVGVFGTYEDAFGGDAAPRRVIAGGVELRPLFFARWLGGLSTGAPHVDLTLDSLALEIGVLALQPPTGPFSPSPGLQVGGALELPLLPRASGPLLALRGGLRFGDGALAGQVEGPTDRSVYFGLSLAWQHIMTAHVVDAFDRAPR